MKNNTSGAKNNTPLIINVMKNLFYGFLVVIILVLLFWALKTRNEVAGLRPLHHVIDSLEHVAQRQATEINIRDSIIIEMQKTDKTQVQQLAKIRQINDSLRKIRTGGVPVYFSSMPVDVARERFIAITNTN